MLCYEHGLISITAYWMTVIYVPLTQLNVTLFGLIYYMTLKFPHTHHEVVYICIYYGSPLAVAKAAATLPGVQQN
jgi:hypothetical protein